MKKQRIQNESSLDVYFLVGSFLVHPLYHVNVDPMQVVLAWESILLTA